MGEGYSLKRLVVFLILWSADMKRLILSILLLLVLFSLQAQTRRALVIGIGDYPSNSGWWQIHGDRDVSIVCNLLNASGFQEDNIRCLTNSEATKEGITEAFSDIAADSGYGDIVFIHFSGHGQQIEDLDGDEAGDPLEPYDEAWIPYDARRTYQRGVYEGENHIIDDEINHYLHEIRKAVGTNGKILVSVDACHSGGSTRGDGDTRISRGTSEVFTFGDNPHPEFQRSGNFHQSWVVISACKSYQTNYETREGFGSLSAAIEKCSDEFRAGSYQSLFEALEREIKAHKSPVPQTPQLDGGVKFSTKVL